MHLFSLFSIPCKPLLAVVFCLSIFSISKAQILITDLEPYQQDFNTLPNTGSQPWANNSTLLGWYGGRGTTSLITNATGISALTSTSTTINTLASLGSASSTERAIGGEGNSTTNKFYIGVRLKNNTNRTIRSFTISYKAESYGETPAYIFSYTTSTSAISGLDFGAGISNSVLNSTSAGTVYKNINDLALAPGSEIIFRWENGSHRSIAIDDVIITPSDVNMCFHVPASGSSLTLTTPFYAHPDGTSQITPVANMGIALIGARSASLGATITSTTLPAGSKVILGDGINVLDFTIPTTFYGQCLVDIRPGSKLTMSHATLPTLGSLASTSTVIHNNATAIAAATYGNLTINGSRTFSTGTATINGTLVVNSGSTLTQTGGVLEINGQINSSTGTYTLSGGEIQYTAASGTQLVAALAYKNLTIAGGGIKQLQGNATVNGTLNFTGSNLTTLNNTLGLTLGASGTITNETADHYFKGKLVVPKTINGIGTTTFGNMGLSFNNTGGGNWGAVTVTRTTDVASLNPKDNAKQSIKRSWNISPQTQAGTNVNMTFKWLASEDNTLNFTNGQAQAWKSTDGGTNWQPVGNLISFDPLGLERTVSLITNSFSVWTFTDPNTPLPVELVSFTAKRTENDIVCSWKTAQELNNDFFTIERSTNGRAFTEAGTVKGKGTTSQASFYTFTDLNSPTDLVYYRLKQTDFDGTTSFSKIIAVTEAQGKAVSFGLYPNPSAGSAVLQTTADLKSPATVSILNAQGQLVKELQVEAAGLKAGLAIDLNDQRHGVYFIRIVAENNVSTLRLVKQ